jgi:hypothetical protein
MAKKKAIAIKIAVKPVSMPKMPVMPKMKNKKNKRGIY